MGGRLAIIEERDGGRVQESDVRTPVSPSRPEAHPPEPPRLRAVGEPQSQPGLAAIPPPAVVRPAPRRTQAAPGADGGAPRRYSPVVLRMAQEHGVDLDLISGTGIDGRVTKRDLQQYLDSLRSGSAAVTSAKPAPPPGAVVAPPLTAAPPAAAGRPGGAYLPPVYQPHHGDVTEPFTRRRKLIAEHMVYSKTHSPHVGTLAEVDMTRVTRLREAHKQAFQEREGFGLTLLPLVAAATVRALKEFPRMNAAVVGESLVIRKEINLGIAMDAEEGLLVPVLKRAEGMSVVGIAREIESLRRKIADRKITADELTGGSFTLSNPGREGNLFGFAIINQPQMGILRMGELKKRAIVIDVDGEDAIAIRAMMYLALSYDHRVIDGVLGNRFLYRTGKIIEEADFEL